MLFSNQGFLDSIRNLVTSATGPKYDGKYLRSIVKELLGNMTMNQTLTDVIIPTFDIKRLQPIIFSTDDVCLSQSLQFTLLINTQFICITLNLILILTEFLYRQKQTLLRMHSYQMFALAHLQLPPFYQHTTLRLNMKMARFAVLISLMVGLLQTIR